MVSKRFRCDIRISSYRLYPAVLREEIHLYGAFKFSPALLCITIILWTPHCYIITQQGQDPSVCSKTTKVGADCCGVK